MVLYCGKSQIVDDRGTMLALASEHDEEILRATVEIGEPHPYRTSLAQLVQRRAPDSRMLRVSVTAEALPPDVDRRLEMLESDYAVAPGASERLASLDAKVPLASVNDEIMLDPAGLCAYRRAGYRLAVWTTQAAPWTTTLARARAGEARMYVVVLDLSTPRAFVVDPDYLVLCGTFGEYRLASCAIDIAKTAQTFVAPGTDVAAGLERVHELAQT
jgi:hypothetical protein